MGEESKPGKIIWAVDPFSGEKAVQLAAAKAMMAYLCGTSCVVEPVYVYRESRVRIPENCVEGLSTQIERMAKEGMAEVFAEAKIPGLLPIKIIYSGHHDLASGVEALVAYGRNEGVNLIVVGTRAKTGFRRFLISSFTEAVLLASEIPVLVVNAGWDGSAGFGKIVFATDFSLESKEAFLKLLPVASARGSKVTLFHQLKYDPLSTMTLAVSADFSFKHLFETTLKDRSLAAQEWVIEGRAAGVEVDSHIDPDPRGDVAESLLKFAAERNAAIAMSAVKGGGPGSIIGGRTLKVLRNAKAPVWVVNAPLFPEAGNVSE